MVRMKCGTCHVMWVYLQLYTRQRKRPHQRAPRERRACNKWLNVNKNFWVFSTEICDFYALPGLHNVILISRTGVVLYVPVLVVGQAAVHVGIAHFYEMRPKSSRREFAQFYHQLDESDAQKINAVEPGDRLHPDRSTPSPDLDFTPRPYAVGPELCNYHLKVGVMSGAGYATCGPRLRRNSRFSCNQLLWC